MNDPKPWQFEGTDLPIIRDQVSTVSIAPRLFTKSECDRIVALAREQGTVKGGTGEAMSASQVRDSDICFLWPAEQTAWMFERLQQLTEQVNRSYQFDLRGFFEGVQITHYAGTGGHYGWHMDLGTGPFSARKLTITVQLSDPESYDGGELQFTSANLQDEAAHQGAAIIFPSFMTHRVNPVTGGERWSMVCWISGDAFR
jgi:PKHD-type hydroxylase